MRSGANGAKGGGVWLKAAAVGSLWASVEIIVGGFLHAVRVPMAGSLLAAIGVALLVGAHRLYPERGLFWRAGLICALMKSISPGAVILGPMIGILAESLLLEAVTRLLGASLVGYTLGGALAVAWCLVQKVAGLIITFGPDIVRLYVRVCELAAGSLRLPGLSPVGLVAAVLALDLLMGGAAALMAAHVGQKARRSPGAEPTGVLPAGQSSWRGFALDPGQRFYLPLALVSLGAISAGVVVLNRMPLPLGGAYAAGFTVWAGLRYRKALRRVTRPRMWLQVALLMLLSGLLLGNLENGPGRWSWDGLTAGARMALRAWLMSAGFAAVSVELRNPKVLAWFRRRGAAAAFDALSVAFAALPMFAAAIAQQRGALRRPRAALAELLGHLDRWVWENRASTTGGAKVRLLVGNSGEGKTTRAAQVADLLRQRGWVVGGILAPGLWSDGKREGFDVVDLLDGRRAVLCRRDGADGPVCGPFYFHSEGLRLGREALRLDRLRAAGADLVIVDEVGPLELSGEGWAPALDVLAAEWPGGMLWLVRRDLAEQVAKRWLAEEAVICEVSRVSAAELSEQFCSVPDVRRQEALRSATGT